MKKMLGFTSFEFYFVMSVIGIIALVAMQRYLQLAGETKRLGFEVVAKHFNASVYNYHARWIMAQSQASTHQLQVDGFNILFSTEGWPLAIMTGEPLKYEVSTNSCLGLWHNLLQNPPSISSEGEDYGTHAYHLSLPQAGTCRFEMVSEPRGTFYFEYAPVSGHVIFYMPSSTKNN